MYRAVTINITQSHFLFGYLEELTKASCNLRNAALFRMRQVLTFTSKEPSRWTDNEKFVHDEIEANLPRMGSVYSMPEENKNFISYYFINALMSVTGNPDYYCDKLPRQCAQEILKDTVRSMKSFFASCREYAKHPDKFTGKPNLPGYSKPGSCHSVTITNQDCVIYSKPDGSNELKLPLTKVRLPLGNADVSGKLKQVTVTPFHGIFIVTLVIDSNNPEKHITPSSRAISIDFGTNNIAAITNNVGEPCLLFKGGVIKSVNQWYNKKMAEYVSKQSTGTDKKFTPTRNSQALCVWRENHISDILHKTACEIIHYCEEWNISTIVIGVNKQQKSGINLGHVNNQQFVQIPFYTLKQLISYRAKRLGITVIEQEESYTSKASFMDNDEIPVWGEITETPVFSGKRIRRGIYKTSDGQLVNADLNGAANIMVKWNKTAFTDNVMPNFNSCKVLRYPYQK